MPDILVWETNLGKHILLFPWSFDFCLLSCRKDQFSDFILYDRLSILYKYADKCCGFNRIRLYCDTAADFPYPTGRVWWGQVGIPLRSPTPLSSILFLPTFSSPQPRLKSLFTGYRLQVDRELSPLLESRWRKTLVSPLMMARFCSVLFYVSPHGVSSERGTPTSQRMANLHNIRDIEI